MQRRVERQRGSAQERRQKWRRLLKLAGAGTGRTGHPAGRVLVVSVGRGESLHARSSGALAPACNHREGGGCAVGALSAAGVAQLVAHNNADAVVLHHVFVRTAFTRRQAAGRESRLCRRSDVALALPYADECAVHIQASESRLRAPHSVATRQLAWWSTTPKAMVAVHLSPLASSAGCAGRRRSAPAPRCGALHPSAFLRGSQALGASSFAGTGPLPTRAAGAKLRPSRGSAVVRHAACVAWPTQ